MAPKIVESTGQEKMKVFLKVMKTFPFEVNSSDTIEVIKAKFWAMEGFAMSQLEIVYDGNQLKDNRTLADYNIPPNSTIYINIGVEMEIFIQIPPSGKTITLKVKDWETIQNVKAKIEDKEGIPLNQQELLYLGRSLADNQLLIACSIGEKSTLELVLRPVGEMHLSVSMVSGKIIKVKVRTWYTIGDVKMIIQSMEKISADQQILGYAGKPLKDYLTLSDYKITDESVLQLEMFSFQMQIFVKTWSGETITLMVRITDTVSKVIKKIEKKMGSEYKLEDWHYFSYTGRILQKKQTLAYYNIQSGSTIHVLTRATSSTLSHIFVKVRYPETITLYVDMRSTIADVKAMIHEKTKIRLREPKVSYLGKELVENDHTLEHYGICSGSTLCLSS